MIAPSILGCDHGRLAEEAVSMEAAGADMIHLDVMDGVFVPVLTFGAGVASSLSTATSLPLDAHLMVRHPGNMVEAFASAGCRYVTVHAETVSHLDRMLDWIRSLGCGAGVALNPATPPEVVRWCAHRLDLVLVMAVNPGYCGQSHIEEVHPKIAEIRRILDSAGREDALISVDGGVTPANASRLVGLGADILVSGSFVSGSLDRAAAIRSLRA